SEVHPNDWTPWNFVNYQYGNNFDEYLDSLKTLDSAGKSALCCHAGAILKWINNPANEYLITQAKSRIKEKICGQTDEIVANTREYEDVNNLLNKKPRIAASYMDSQSSTTSISLDEPWSNLMIACVNKLRNHNTDDLDNLSFEGLKPIEIVILKLSRKLLQQTHLSTKETKDLMVAMSGILDLRSWECRIAPSAIEDALYAENDEIKQLNTQLAKDLHLGLPIFALKCDVKIGDISKMIIQGEDAPFTTPMLRFVSHLANIIERGNIPISEGEIVGLWKTALEILSEGKLKFLSGEKICKATQAAKHRFKEIFGVDGETDSGRKVDLMLRIGDLEILNTEAKVLDNDGICDQQYKKNIRINHAIYQEAKFNSVELPPMMFLDIRGYSAMVCQLKKVCETSNLVSYQNQILAQLETAKELSTTINTKRKIANLDDDADDTDDRG
ncbi:hypothetical protein BGZ76_009990, partial [Entomortierella beljakovae]